MLGTASTIVTAGSFLLAPLSLLLVVAFDKSIEELARVISCIQFLNMNEVYLGSVMPFGNML